MASRPLPTNLSPQEYLEFEQNSEVRHEYVDGIVYETPGESLENNEVGGNIYAELRKSAKSAGCRLAFEGIKLWLPRLNRYYYPDVMVLCDSRDTDTHIFEYPCFIAEVVSPSTEATDRREKLQAYREIETLQTYWIVDPTTRSLEVFERSQNWQGVRLESGSAPVECLNVLLKLEDIFA
jgi:Uma2 family endonuclease